MSRVFISYSHDTKAHASRVKKLAEKLKDEGIEVDFDQFVEDPDEGFRVWSRRQAEKSTRILICVTETYRRRWDGDEQLGKGLGATYEARIIANRLYNNMGRNTFCRVVLFNNNDEVHIPIDLQDYRIYQTQSDYSKFRDWILKEDGTKADPGAISLEKPPEPWPPRFDAFTPKIADRRSLFDWLYRLLAGEVDERILLIRGLTNFGKTELLRQFERYTREVKLDRIWVDLHGLQTSDQVIDEIFYEGEPRMFENLGATKNENSEIRGRALFSDLKSLKKPVVFFFDTFEEAGDTLGRWMENVFLKWIERSERAAIILAGQQVPKSNMAAWENSAITRHLGGIKKGSDWYEFAKINYDEPAVTEQQCELLVKAAEGIPGELRTMLDRLHNSDEG